jgi:hypothetical protein
MKSSLFLVVSALLLIPLLSACGAEAPQELSGAQPQVAAPEPINPPPSKPESTPSSVPQQNSTDESSFVPRGPVEKAKADLAAYLNIEAGQIKVVEAQAVAWPDSSLGCPQPGTVYAQVITPGYYIVLESQRRLYPYHTDQGDQIVLCPGKASGSEAETPLPIIPINPGDIDDGQPWMP